MLVELSRSADWWEFQASPATLDADTVALGWSSRQDVRGVGPRRPVRRPVGDDPGGTAQACGAHPRASGARVAGPSVGEDRRPCGARICVVTLECRSALKLKRNGGTNDGDSRGSGQSGRRSSTMRTIELRVRREEPILSSSWLTELNGCAVYEQLSCTADHTRRHIPNIDDCIGSDFLSASGHPLGRY